MGPIGYRLFCINMLICTGTTLKVDVVCRGCALSCFNVVLVQSSAFSQNNYENAKHLLETVCDTLVTTVN